MEDAVCFFSPLHSTSQLPWSAWAVPPCCVCLPLLWSPMSRPCSSLPCCPWQSCATSSRSISEWPPGKGTHHHHPASGDSSCSAGVNCTISVQGSCVIKFGPVKAAALSASGTNALQWNCILLQGPLSAALRAELLAWGRLCMSRVFVHDQRFLEFTGHKKTPAGFCPPLQAVCWVPARKCGQGNWSLPVQVKVEIYEVQERLQNAA